MKWKPEQYLIFEKERTQPSLDLMMRIEKEDPDKIIDMGCGPGNSTFGLKNRWPKAYIVGLDNSDEMLAQARKKFSGIEWLKYDMSRDLSKIGKFDIVFSSAAVQWVEDKVSLINGMFEMLNTNGILAVQVPYPVNLKFKAEIKKTAFSDKWAKYFSGFVPRPEFHDYEYYYGIISKLTDKVSIWKTEYVHIMTHEDIVEWDKGTGANPYLEMLPSEELRKDFLNDYLNALKEVYPLGENKKALVPFTRIFFTANK